MLESGLVTGIGIIGYVFIYYLYLVDRVNL